MININNYLSELTTHVKFILKYLHKNAWTIVFIIAGSYVCYDWFIEPFLQKYREQKSYAEATNPDRVAVLSPDMKRVRAKQQEHTMQRSIEAAEERKKKLAADRERKRVKSPEEKRWEKLGGEGTKLGDQEEEKVADGGDGLRRRRR